MGTKRVKPKLPVPAPIVLPNPVEHQKSTVPPFRRKKKKKAEIVTPLITNMWQPCMADLEPPRRNRKSIDEPIE